jgi:DNA polymerase-1
LLCLIDGDVLFYQYAFPFEKTIQWDSHTTSKAIQPDQATDKLNRFVDDLKKACKAKEYLIVYSGEFNFRYGVLPTYKSNRSDNEKPWLHGYLKDYVKANHPTECWEGIEADDTLGILGSSDHKYVVCTIDKDLFTVPCNLYNWNKMGKPRIVSTTEADWFWLYQVLIGDTVDGYKGCPMIGDIKARKILGEPGEYSLDKMWELVVQAYQNTSTKQAKKVYGKEQLTEEDALVQARVARILRQEDWDEKKKKPILWRP